MPEGGTTYYTNHSCVCCHLLSIKYKQQILFLTVVVLGNLDIMVLDFLSSFFFFCKFISLTDLMIHNKENVTSARYSLLHNDEAMNDIISLIILNNYIIIRGWGMTA